MDRKNYIENYGEEGYIDFSRLWDLMKRRKLNKEFLKKNGIHSNTVQKLVKNESVTCVVLSKLCHLLNVQVWEICEYKEKQED